MRELLVSLPSEKELRDPERKALLLKYLKGRSDISTEDRMRMFKFLNHFVASPHAAQAWIGGGAPYHLRMALYEGTDLEDKKETRPFDCIRLRINSSPLSPVNHSNAR